jgi:hypothetical protein
MLKPESLPETSRLIATRSRYISHIPNPDTDRTQHAASRNAGQGGLAL